MFLKESIVPPHIRLSPHFPPLVKTPVTQLSNFDRLIRSRPGMRGNKALSGSAEAWCSLGAVESVEERIFSFEGRGRAITVQKLLFVALCPELVVVGLAWKYCGGVGKALRVGRRTRGDLNPSPPSRLLRPKLYTVF